MQSVRVRKVYEKILQGKLGLAYRILENSKSTIALGIEIVDKSFEDYIKDFFF